MSCDISSGSYCFSKYPFKGFWSTKGKGAVMWMLGFFFALVAAHVCDVACCHRLAEICIVTVRGSTARHTVNQILEANHDSF